MNVTDTPGTMTETRGMTETARDLTEIARDLTEIDGAPILRSRTELDLLLVNIEAAVRVRKRSDFFSWVQGVFQGLVPHEVLICSLADPGSRVHRMEWMSSAPVDDAQWAQLCGAGGGLVHRMIRLWEQSGRLALALDARTAAAGADSALLAEAQRLDLDNVLAHGVPDMHGRACGFFCFAKIAGGIRSEHAIALDLAVPYLHAAWVRAWCDGSRQERANSLPAREILTAREVEILKWVEQGKSNSEIARILGISHLTVKNHVQKILRKLDVQNRAHAVARGISLNLTGALVQ